MPKNKTNDWTYQRKDYPEEKKTKKEKPTENLFPQLIYKKLEKDPDMEKWLIPLCFS